jgi:hypothetical protein
MLPKPFYSQSTHNFITYYVWKITWTNKISLNQKDYNVIAIHKICFASHLMSWQDIINDMSFKVSQTLSDKEGGIGSNYAI